MSTIPVTSASHLCRPVGRGDIEQITALAQHGRWPAWILEDLPRLLKARQTCCWVAEQSGRLVGFAIGSIRPPIPSEAGIGSSMRMLVGRWMGHHPRRVLVDLFDVEVAPACESSEVEHELLERLHKQLGRLADRLRIVVPETSLASQVFLHEAGYQAVRVLHNYFGDQDGYLMQRARVEQTEM